VDNYLQFEPRIQDFGDDYHRPDEEVFADVDNEVRNLRHKYRKFTDYVYAIRVIERYMAKLAEKYGGKRNLEEAIELGTCREYIPPMPTFRHTKENVALCENGMMLSNIDTDQQDYDLDEETQAAVDAIEGRMFSQGMEIVESDLVYLPFAIDKKTMINMDTETDAITRELEALQNYSVAMSSSKKKKGKSKHNIAKEVKRRRKMLAKAHEPETVGDMIRRWNESVYEDPYLEGSNDMVMYRGIMIRQTELNDMKLDEALTKCGFKSKDDYSGIRNKNLRKMIKKNNKAEKKRKKKKYDFDSEDMDEFIDAYNDSDAFGTEFGKNFEAFEREMLAFDAAGMRRAMEED